MECYDSSVLEGKGWISLTILPAIHSRAEANANLISSNRKILKKEKVWVWASFGSWWRTGKPGMLQSMGVSKSWTDWVTEKQQQSYMWVGGWINNLMLKIACCHDFMSWEEQDKRHKLIIKLMPRELGRKKKRTL